MKAVSVAEHRTLRRPEGRRAWRLPLRAALSLLTGIGFALACALLTNQSLRQTLALLAERPLAVLAQGVFLGLLTFGAASALRSLPAGGAVVCVLVLAAGLVNHFKTLITSTPLQLTDFGLIGRLGDITALNRASISLSRNTIVAIASCVLWLAVLWWLARMTRPESWRNGLVSAGAACALFILCFAVRPVTNAWCFAPMGADMERYYDQAYVYRRCGVPLGLWRAVLLTGNDYSFDPEDRASVLADAQDILDGVPTSAGDDVRPNVIVILSESFFDVTGLPGVVYDDDPAADFHTACGEGVSGTFYTRTLGYGTCNIELELLTGINTRFFASDEMLCYWDGVDFDKLSAVPRVFQDNGYYTAFVHTFSDSIYNRTPLYTHLGFDDLYFSGDFAQIDPDAAAAEDYWAYMDGHIAGSFYSDDYMADLLIDLYERERENGPVFLYAATMENHTPFTADKYDGYAHTFASGLSGEAEGVLNAVTQGVADASAMLGKLMDYFSHADEPTVILFFGDHRPGLPLEDGGTVYSALGMCPADTTEWSLAELAELYSTDYVIWANDADLLPGVPGEREDISGAFLGLRALEAAKLPLDAYWRMVKAVSDSCTAYTWNFFVSSAGALSTGLPENLPAAERKTLETMTWLMREAFSDTDTAQPAFYQLR